ncbi:MAG: hypothetical protein R3343_09170 [Nitriliruptorales bacterium]|nr:hypothetical protein [Nitriliruptorales bacterium]
MRTRRPLLLVATIAIVATLAAWLHPWSRARLTGVATVAEGFGAPIVRPLAPTVSVHTTRLADTEVDVYVGGDTAPVLVLVPGAVPAGRDDERVRRLAHVLARAERRVVVPELAVYDERLVEEDVSLLVDLVVELSSDGGEVAFVGISFGGSLALVAAADPAVDGRLAGVATFGAHADLVGVLQAATTGVSVVGGDTIPWDADPRAQEVVRDKLTGLLAPDQADAVRAALDSDGSAGLSPGAEAVRRLLANDDPRRTYELADALPAPIRARLASVSPVAVADQLGDVPIVAMHSREDRVIPYGELLRLGTALPHARLLTVDSLAHAELELTDPGGWIGALDDLWTTWSFTGRALHWQEPTWPWGDG